MNLETIAVGVDFSAESSIARVHGEALARAHDAELVLVHASGIDSAGMYVFEVAGRTDEPWKAYVHARLEHQREQLRRLCEELCGRGLRARPRHIHGFADTSLLEVADEEGADLIVVGTHGRTGVERWLLGSVAERVVRLSSRHVMVARGEPSGSRFERILVPTDFSESSSRALDLAVRLAAPGARVDILHAWHDPLAFRDELTPSWLRERLGARAQALSAELVGGRHPEAELRVENIEGDPALVIDERLARGGYDCAVLGSHGRRGVRRMLLGSVAEQTVRHAPCSIFVAHG